MNEVLRIFDKLLKHKGYTIKKHPEHNLLPLKNFENFPVQKKIYNVFNTENQRIINNNILNLNICLRTCISKKRIFEGKHKLTKVSYEKHFLKCIHSLVIATNEAVKNNKNVSLTVFDDHSEASSICKIELLLNKLECKWRLITTKVPGQGESLYEQFDFCREKNSLFYFCEDDYLHTRSAINEMIDFYKNIYLETDSHLLIHPQEHELIYSQINYPSYILLGEHRRWRTISHATHTFFTHSSVVDKYWKYFIDTKYVGNKKKRHLGSEKKTTDNLFHHIPGFSPIPAVAVHLQTEKTLPPYFDWEEVWNKIGDS